MKKAAIRILFISLICSLNLGLFLQPIKAQIHPLTPVWEQSWIGTAGITGPCTLLGIDICPCNAWDVHVYGDTVYSTGIKTEDSWNRVGPLVLNAYTLDGDTVWQKTWAGYTGIHGTGAGGSVLLGHGGYLYLGGAVSIDSMNGSLLQKWDLSGNLIWTHHWGDKPIEGHHEVNGLAIVDHYLYVSHYSAASGFETADAHIKKFDLDLLNADSSWSAALLWDREYGLPGAQNSTDGHIYADTSGVYICGGYGGPAGTHVYDEGDAYLIKFDPLGDSLWMRLYTGNGTGGDGAFNLKSDGNHIFLTGPTTTYVNPWLGFPWELESQVFVQKYTMEGTLVWTKLFGGSKTEYSRGLEVDDEYIYMAASTKSYVDSLNDGLDNTLLITLRKDSGDLVCRRVWGELGIDNANTSIDQDQYGAIYLSGFSTSDDNGAHSERKRAVILKVNKDDLVSTEEVATACMPISFTVYPNPFSSEATIHLDHQFKGATLTIYDSRGKLVRKRENLSGKNVTIRRNLLPAGAFLYRLTQEDKVIAGGKIIIQ